MGAEFIATEEIMQEILVGKYPILLIDESQDTRKELIDALFIVHEK
jgi:DNA helicase-2/ATP-dependent DNA helicase PcrA